MQSVRTIDEDPSVLMKNPKQEWQDLVSHLARVLEKVMSEADIKSSLAHGALELLPEAGMEDSNMITFRREDLTEILEAARNAGAAKGARYAVEEILSVILEWQKVAGDGSDPGKSIPFRK